MLMALSSTDRAKLIAILGMMGSDHDGEALNAARLASRIVRSSKTTWEEILTTKEAPVTSWQPQLRPWQVTAERVLSSYPDLVTEWEAQFLESIGRRFRPPTDKQSEILARILQKVLRG